MSCGRCPRESRNRVISGTNFAKTQRRLRGCKPAIRCPSISCFRFATVVYSIVTASRAISLATSSRCSESCSSMALREPHQAFVVAHRRYIGWDDRRHRPREIRSENLASNHLRGEIRRPLHRRCGMRLFGARLVVHREQRRPRKGADRLVPPRRQSQQSLAAQSVPLPPRCRAGAGYFVLCKP